MPEARQLYRIVGDLHPDKLATLRKPQLLGRAELIYRKMAGGVRRVGDRIAKSNASRNREEEARVESMRDAQEIAEIHRLGKSVGADGEIAAHVVPWIRVA